MIALQTQAIKDLDNKTEDVKKKVEVKGTTIGSSHEIYYAGWKVYHKECNKELFDLDKIFLFVYFFYLIFLMVSAPGNNGKETVHVCAKGEELDGCQFIEIVAKKERPKDPFKAVATVLCKGCKEDDGKIGGINRGLGTAFIGIEHG